MPYKKSDLFKTPDDKQVIWRYMNYDKFIDLLEKQALYFFNLLKYRNLGDPQEGDLPEYNKNNLGSGYFLVNRHQATPEDKQKAIRLLENILCVNCWGMDKKEVKRKWTEYANSTHSIAIKTSVGNLKKALEKCQYEIFMGKISYIDYQTDIYHYPDPFGYSFLKNKFKFDWEHELRLACLATDHIRGGNINLGTYDLFRKSSVDQFSMADYAYVSCDLDFLIEEVIISPWADDCFLVGVQNKLKSVGLNKVVKKSYYTGKLNEFIRQ